MSAIVRIALRYIAGVLIAKGLLPGDIGNELSTDPELINLVEVSIGLLAGALAEVWFWLSTRAKKLVDEYRSENL